MGKKREKIIRELQHKFSIEVATEIEAIWSDCKIDLVDIRLPNRLHKDNAIKALHAGKYVFIEAPVAETLEDAQTILNAAEQSNKRVFVDLFLRFEFAYEYLYQLVRDKTFGNLEVAFEYATVRYFGNGYPDGKIETNLELFCDRSIKDSFASGRLLGSSHQEYTGPHKKWIGFPS